MKRRKPALVAMALVAGLVPLLPVSSARAQETPPAATAEGPVVQSLYVEIPAAGSAVANAMMAANIGSSNAVKQLEQYMAMGETAQLTVVAFGTNERLTLKAAEAALKSFQGKSLPHLTLGVVASADKVEKLRPLAVPLGIELVVAPALNLK